MCSLPICRTTVQPPLSFVNLNHPSYNGMASPVIEKLKNYATGTHGKDFSLFNQIHLEQMGTLQCTCCVTLNMGLGAGNMTQWIRAFAVLPEYLSLGCQHPCQVSQHPVTPVLDLSPQVSEANCTHVHILTWRHIYPFLGYLH